MRSEATNFFQRQDDSRKKTGGLFVLLGVAVLGLSAGTLVGVAAIYLVGWIMFFEQVPTELPWVGLALVSLALTAGFILVAGIYKRSKLSQGGAVIVEELGGVEVDGSGRDPERRQLMNVVEEMAISAGIPVPRVFVLEDQSGINAFAAGFSINDAAIAVTRGAIDELNREELQAVVAHEFSHILNGDMRLNVRLLGIVHGMMLPFIAGLTLWELDDNNADSSPGDQLRLRKVTMTGRKMGWMQSLMVTGCLVFPFVMIPGVMLAIGGRFGAAFAEGIKAAINRQREFLADAAAVQFTRNPEAMVSALEKIRSHPVGSRLRGARARMVNHMCFSNVAGRYRRGGGALSSHPPLEKRIESLGALPEPVQDSRIVVRRDLEIGEGTDGSVEHRGGEDVAGVDADELMAHVAEPSPEKLAYCASLLDEIPGPLREATEASLSAAAVAAMLLLDDDDEVRTKQADVVQHHGSDGLRRECRRLWPEISMLDRRLELPLMDLLFPSLRRMTPGQFEQFKQMVEAMVHVDGEVAFRDFIFERVLLHRLEIALCDADRDDVQFRSFTPLGSDIERVLSCMAVVGTDDNQALEQAFEDARAQLPSMIRDDIQLQPADEWSFDEVGESLERLAVALPNIKQVTVRACARCVVSDGRVVVGEAEMFRAVAENLDVPLGPVVG